MPDGEGDRQTSTLDEAASAPVLDVGAPVLIDARATDAPEAIRSAAVAASSTACHGTTSCPGGLVIGSLYGVDCGTPYCSLDPCGTTGDFTKLKQPREYYRPYAMPDGSVCLAYQPATPRTINCSCGESF